MSDDAIGMSAKAGGSAAGGSRAGSSLARLRALLLDDGGLMASMVDPSWPDGSAAEAPAAEAPAADAPAADAPSAEAPAVDAPAAGPAQLAASGPRVGARAADYELLVEAIYEGYLLHYRAARLVRAPEHDVGLLAGDRLYALGLARLVKLGDIEAVAELADVITLSALAHGSDVPELADAVWMAGARAVGWGSSPGHERAKVLARAGSAEALEAMRSLAHA